VGNPRPLRALDQRDRAIVDEVFRRGGSVSDAMEVLFARALDKSQQGSTEAQRWLQRPLPRSPASKSPGADRTPRFTLEDRGLLDSGDLPERQERELDKVDEVRLLVQDRFAANLATWTTDFARLKSPQAKESFEPLRKPPHVDPYATPLEKYLAMRGAYYRAGWACINRDVFDQIVPATFFGIPVQGGVHREMARVLKAVEDKFPGGLQGLDAGFVIGGFVPRFQEGSAQLSNHAFGLAIDIDPKWNPQLKSAAARAAFARATGEDIGRSLYPVSSADMAAKIYEKVAAISKRLQEWLNLWLPQYEQLMRSRADAVKDPEGKQKAASIDRQIGSDQDLSAVAVLVREYSLATVKSWQAGGIGTIPPLVIQAFLEAGSPNGARWGGQYDNSKDFMHFELLKLVGKDSLARPGRPGLRKPVPGFDDLRRGEPPPEPDCGPAPAPKVPVAPLR
jgi:hypothetical protein